ncbi:UDP-N-acetylglucosamine 1-carboxyvinyltransferase [SCandidatus Aminicenantes bacterium Aminicenantia_JdfR_composite]|jgi:UDP-N-acetylglucosamine 1-carboxyvinyltransferase|nr:UDP-N-acetylglucosamine 1-carboxyvinyltransferase [SCandidatus Aminicenantes bacterium Aminicenantia_JdfR_composite]MCP2597412.1 UDP-N-acetylglucosamine 1-carboxyvinyltransferase [Candidatus Aminicenantes bacterium AC-335-G13]
MDKIWIKGGQILRGKVKISGAKNAVLPAIAASLLTHEEIILKNVPLVQDVFTMLTLIKELGGRYKLNDHEISIKVENIQSFEAPYELVKTMRASILVLGPLLARYGEAVVALPGGCAIGSRPIDLHMQGLEKLGAKLKLEHGYIKAKAKKLKGTEIEFSKVTVTGTENLIMAACLAKGETVLKNCAKEPEVVDLCNLLISMGAKIEGVGTDTVRIRGVEELKGTTHYVIPDRIEAGTFLVAGGLIGDEIIIENVYPHHLDAVIEKIRFAGINIEKIDSKTLKVNGNSNIRSQDVTTSPYPGFPTDMQAQFMVLMTQANGISIITETIFDRRFLHVNELLRLGADIRVIGDKAIVKGGTPLSGAEVVATDLRASASLVLAGLIADGETVVSQIHHLDRGYERIEEKLAQLGAKIKRIKGEE